MGTKPVLETGFRIVLVVRLVRRADMVSVAVQALDDPEASLGREPEIDRMHVIGLRFGRLMSDDMHVRLHQTLSLPWCADSSMRESARRVFVA